LTAIVKLTSGDCFEGTIRLDGAWLIVEGRRRLQTNGDLLYSAPARWTWPARAVASIREDIE
jgi:hypothetical protein